VCSSHSPGSFCDGSSTSTVCHIVADVNLLFFVQNRPLNAMDE
jgi:hypothetical protein